MSDEAFNVGDRVAFHNGLGYDPEWFFGRVNERALRAGGHHYRVRWDDGFEDAPESIEEWYSHGELHAAEWVENRQEGET